MAMRWCAALLMLLALPAWASEADIQSPACRDALAALQTHESAMAASTPAAPDRPAAATADPAWRALRAHAAQICLGGEPDAPPPPPRGATAPIAVAPVTAVPPAAQTPPTRSAPPPLPARSLPPIVVLGCDASSCWTNSGERLPQAGRSPFEPRVHCTVQGRFVMCL
jgi:hypothetical protein